MKPKASLRSFISLPGSALLSITLAQADIHNWDGADIGVNVRGGKVPTMIEKNTTLCLQHANHALLNTSGINLQGGVILLNTAAARNSPDQRFMNNTGTFSWVPIPELTTALVGPLLHQRV